MKGGGGSGSGGGHYRRGVRRLRQHLLVLVQRWGENSRRTGLACATRAKEFRRHGSEKALSKGTTANRTTSILLHWNSSSGNASVSEESAVTQTRI